MRLRKPARRAGELHDVFVDETSQSGHRLLLIGGIVLPQKYSELFRQEIIDARLPQIPERNPDGNLRQIGWSEFAASELDTYRRVVETFFSFRNNFDNPTFETIEAFANSSSTVRVELNPP